LQRRGDQEKTRERHRLQRKNNWREGKKWEEERTGRELPQFLFYNLTTALSKVQVCHHSNITMKIRKKTELNSS